MSCISLWERCNYPDAFGEVPDTRIFAFELRVFLQEIFSDLFVSMVMFDPNGTIKKKVRRTIKIPHVWFTFSDHGFKGAQNNFTESTNNCGIQGAYLLNARKATSQSAAPATKKRRACIDTLPKYCACHAKHENDLTFCDLGAPKRAFCARLPPLFILWRKGLGRSACVPPNGEELTTHTHNKDAIRVCQ